MSWSDFNIAEDSSLYWEIVPLIICYIKLNVQDENYIHETNRRWQNIPPFVVAFLFLSLSSLIIITKQMNITLSADDILGTPQKPKALSLTAKSCPCVISSWAPQTIPWQRVLSAFSRTEDSKRERAETTTKKGFHYFIVNDLLNQSSFGHLSSHQRGVWWEGSETGTNRKMNERVPMAWDSCCQDSVYRETVALELLLQGEGGWLGPFLRLLAGMKTAGGWTAQGEWKDRLSRKGMHSRCPWLGTSILFSLVWLLHFSSLSVELWAPRLCQKHPFYTMNCYCSIKWWDPLLNFALGGRYSYLLASLSPFSQLGNGTHIPVDGIVNKSQHLRTYRVPGSIQTVLHVLTHLVLRTALWVRCCCFCHF